MFINGYQAACQIAPKNNHKVLLDQMDWTRFILIKYAVTVLQMWLSSTIYFQTTFNLFELQCCH